MGILESVEQNQPAHYMQSDIALHSPLLHLPFPEQQIVEFADDNYKFNEYGIKSSKQVENTVGKGEI